MSNVYAICLLGGYIAGMVGIDQFHRDRKRIGLGLLALGLAGLCVAAWSVFQW